MKTILMTAAMMILSVPCVAQTHGLGGDEPQQTEVVANAKTYGLSDSVDPLPVFAPLTLPSPSNVSAPVYETVNVTSGFRTVCFGDHCEQVPIVTKIRRLVTAKPIVSVTVAKAVATPVAMPTETCPCGCGLEGCTCGMANSAIPTGTAEGFPPPGFHDHTDSAGNTWRHEHSNNGNTAAHLSPYTGELVLDRSADSSVGVSAGRVRFAPLRGIRARFGLRR